MMGIVSDSLPSKSLSIDDFIWSSRKDILWFSWFVLIISMTKMLIFKQAAILAGVKYGRHIVSFLLGVEERH